MSEKLERLNQIKRIAGLSRGFPKRASKKVQKDYVAEIEKEVEKLKELIVPEEPQDEK